jgi:hypothetical protein
MEFKSFYRDILDTQVDVLHQYVSVHQPSALSGLLGGSTSMDADVDRGCGGRAKCLHDFAAGAPLHRPSDVVEVARAGVLSLDPHDQAVPGCTCHFCVS